MNSRLTKTILRLNSLVAGGLQQTSRDSVMTTIQTMSGRGVIVAARYEPPSGRVHDAGFDRSPLAVRLRSAYGYVL